MERKSFRDMTPEEMDKYLESLDGLGDADLDRVSQGLPVRKLRKSLRLQIPRIRFPEISKARVDNLILAIPLVCSGAFLLFSLSQMLGVQDWPAHWWASKQKVKTIVEFCFDADFEGRVCYVKNEEGYRLRKPMRDMK
jgi:hypothetical protein